MEAIVMVNAQKLPVKNFLPIIPADKSEAFIRISNKQKITKEQLKKCAISKSKFKFEA